MKQNKRFILLVVMVLLANCLFAGLASAAYYDQTVSGIVILPQNAPFDGTNPGTKIELIYDQSEVTPYDTIYPDEQAVTVKIYEASETANDLTHKMTSGPYSRTINAVFTGDGLGDYSFDVNGTKVAAVYNKDLGIHVATATIKIAQLGTSTLTITAGLKRDTYYGSEWVYDGVKASATVIAEGDAADELILVEKPNAGYKTGDEITVGMADATLGSPTVLRLTQGWKHNVEVFVLGRNLVKRTWTYGEEIHDYTKSAGKWVLNEKTGNLEWIPTTSSYEYQWTGVVQYQFSDLDFSVDGSAVLTKNGNEATIKFTKPGTVTLKVWLAKDPRYVKSISFTVKQNPDSPVDTTLKLVNEAGKTSATVKLTKGVAPATFTLKAQDAKVTIVKFKSSKTSVATIDEKTGVVTIVKDKEGTVQFTGYDKDGNAYIFNLKVKKVPVSKLTVAKKSLTLKVGENAKIEVTTKPAYAYNPAVKFTSGDKKIATVDADGYVWAKKAGTTTVTVTPKFAKDTVNPVVVKVKVK